MSIKLVVYFLDVTDDDKRLIENYMIDKAAERITFLTVDPMAEIRKEKAALAATCLTLHDDVVARETVIDEQNQALADQAARIEELEASGQG